MHIAYNAHKSNEDIVGRQISLSGHFMSLFYPMNDVITALRTQ